MTCDALGMYMSLEPAEPIHDMHLCGTKQCQNNALCCVANSDASVVTVLLEVRVKLLVVLSLLHCFQYCGLRKAKLLKAHTSSTAKLYQLC